MKRLIFPLFLLACVTTVVAQVQKQDTLWGAYCYFEKSGQITGVVRETNPLTDFARDAKQQLVYYVLADPCTASMYLNLSAKAGARPNLSVRVVEVESGAEVSCETIVTPLPDGDSQICVIHETQLPHRSWYRIELTARNWKGIRSINNFYINHNSLLPIKPSPIFMAPSVHLNDWQSTDPNAPRGEAYDWAYMEVMLPKQFERKNTYVMSLGVLSGYMGMQIIDDDNTYKYKHRVLFSMWDQGNTDNDPNLPDYLRSGALDSERGVEIKRFGGEGTGTRSMIYDSHWQCGNWVQFITTCRPEVLDITIKGSQGQDSIIEYCSTLVSAWYKEANESTWHYLSTLRESGRNHYMAGWYSFLENFTDDGGEFYRRAYYRNGYFHSLSDNKWYHRNKVGFGHTQGSDKAPRYDYGHGATDVYPGAFYLEHGGYSLLANDSAMTVPLATDHTPVDTINTAALWARMQQAIRKECVHKMDALIEQAPSVKALAKQYVDNADKFDYYSREATASLQKLYDSGCATDAALTKELRQLALTADPIKQGLPIRVEHIGVARAYQIVLDDGKTVVDRGGSVGYAADNIATDNAYNWRFVRQGNTNRFLIVNMATKKYLALNGVPRLSDVPVEITIDQHSDGHKFVLTAGNTKLNCKLIDNYYAQ